MYDILIRGGTLYDGSGSAGVPGDLAIEDGRIVAIGKRRQAPRRKPSTPAGLAVAPGFIDIKTHSDFTLPINPKAESKVRQGVTTEIIGHCGFSVAPALPGKVDLLKDYLAPSAPWLPFKELTLSAVSRHVPGDVGERRHAGRPQHAPPDGDGHGRIARRSKAELDAMVALLEDGLKAGALGMSSGLFTSPGSYAKPDEMIAFGHVLKRYNAGYFTHLRDESNKVLEAVEEAIEIAEQCGVHVEIVHFKCSGMDNWGKAATALQDDR